MKSYYYRHRPHFQPPGATLFVTFRLHGSLPKQVIQKFKSEYEALNKMKGKHLNIKGAKNNLHHFYNSKKQLLERYDTFLHKNSNGPHYLKDNRIAQLVCDCLEFWSGKKYDLLAFCVMSNHVHVLFTPLEIKNGYYYPIANIMHSIKSYTANEANKILKRRGKPFWTHESFDHVCRSREEIERVAKYIINNPVKAGIAKSAEDWNWSYHKYWQLNRRQSG